LGVGKAEAKKTTGGVGERLLVVDWNDRRGHPFGGHQRRGDIGIVCGLPWSKEGNGGGVCWGGREKRDREKQKEGRRGNGGDTGRDDTGPPKGGLRKYRTTYCTFLEAQWLLELCVVSAPVYRRCRRTRGRGWGKTG